MLSYDDLLNAVGTHAAIRRRRRLQPIGGQGDKIFPPTYPGEGKNDPPRHVYEVRRNEGSDVVCVLIDSVQSQADRLEEALLAAAKSGHCPLPRVVVDFPSTGLNSVPEIISVGVPVEEVGNRTTGELRMRTAGRRTAAVSIRWAFCRA